MTKYYYYHQASILFVEFCILDLQTEYCFVAACFFFLLRIFHKFICRNPYTHDLK
jgi:hypothetical protein